MNDDTGELEASEEELLEELQTDCAVRVQKQARALKARRQVRNMIKTTFAKEYDQENDRMVYRNKVTGLVQRTKPTPAGRGSTGSHCVCRPEGYESVPAEETVRFSVDYYHIQ